MYAAKIPINILFADRKEIVKQYQLGLINEN